jgi:hypothetical protein
MKKYISILSLFIITSMGVSCSNDDDSTKGHVQGTAKLTNIEIGLNNNEIGTIGRDFHFNMDVLAKGKIDYIKVEISQIPSENYSGEWTHEVIWDQYKGLKNSNVHKHFDIPAEAIEGKYNFVISVYDTNGDITVENRHISLYLADNLPVNPEIYTFNVLTDDGIYYTTDDGYMLPEYSFQQNSNLKAICRLSGVKGDGKMYVLLIKKRLNHKPETVSAIDFTKAVVYDVYEHRNMPEVGEIVSTLNNFPIGALTDLNTPQPNSIDGLKAWETGDYYLGVVYTNTTYNISYFNYIDIKINY